MNASALPDNAPLAQRLPAMLPAIYRDDPFLSRYLWAFERVLLGIEEGIAQLPALFDPAQAPPEFLPWLSSWIAFASRGDFSIAQQRRFIARIAPLYRRRGTKENLRELLTIFTHGAIPTIEEDPATPHFFRVTMRLPSDTPEAQLRQSSIAHALIDLEKPAHTYYELQLLFPTMQIGVTSTIGVDTLLGTYPSDSAAARASQALDGPQPTTRKSTRRART